MGRNLLLVFAEQGPEIVAAAFNLIGERSLYGRHWGCFKDFHSLHFEACYYQGLDYCIANGLTRFDPGAQGEHKVSRGFLPTPTWSAHWIADPRFRAAIGQLSRPRDPGDERVPPGDARPQPLPRAPRHGQRAAPDRPPES